MFGPQFEGLRMEDFINIAEEANDKVLNILLIKKEIMSFPKSYLVPVLQIVLGQNFKKLVDKRSP
jgi:hypothetical protein